MLQVVLIVKKGSLIDHKSHGCQHGKVDGWNENPHMVCRFGYNSLKSANVSYNKI